jgi:hypothetical protein
MQETSGCEWGAQLSYRTSVVVKCDRCPSLLTDYLTSHGVLRIVADAAKHTRVERSIRGAVQLAGLARRQGCCRALAGQLLWRTAATEEACCTILHFKGLQHLAVERVCTRLKRKGASQR